ncbi:MAG: hypothetical protein EBU96_06075 [Actinobacteria bacterium]|nr:hypothetical protein [Actinomycetota bacterium]
MTTTKPTLPTGWYEPIKLELRELANLGVEYAEDALISLRQGKHDETIRDYTGSLTDLVDLIISLEQIR